MPPKQTDPQYKLRMTPEIKAQLDAASEASGRSLNAEILDRLDYTFRAPRMAEGHIMAIRRAAQAANRSPEAELEFRLSPPDVGRDDPSYRDRVLANERKLDAIYDMLENTVRSLQAPETEADVRHAMLWLERHLRASMRARLDKDNRPERFSEAD